MPRLTKIAAVLVAVLMGTAIVGSLLVTRTTTGRDWVRGVTEAQLTGLLQGRGTITVASVTSLTPSSIEVRGLRLTDRWGASVARIDTARLVIDLSALRRRVVHFRRIDVRGARFDIVQRFDSVWNVVSLLPDSSGPRKGPPGWGDDVYADTVRLSGVAARVAMLWAPHPVFTTRRERDSVTTLYRTLHDVRDTAGRMVVTRRWWELSSDIVDAHFVRPTGGGRVVLNRLASRMSDPAMPIRDARGSLEWTPNKRLQIELPEVQLTASRGAVRGSVSWADRGPVRYDLTVPADSVALSDIHWVWPALPRTGGGHTVLDIRSQANADIVDYTLDSLFVRAEGSEVRGRVTVTVSPRDIALSRLRLDLAPLTAPVWRGLLTTEPPTALRGAIRGRVIAEVGGPLTALRLDTATLAYQEQTGAVGRIDLSGVVGSAAAVTLRDVTVRSLELPLSLVQPLVAEWPAGVEGVLSASGRLSADLGAGSVDATGLKMRLVAPGDAQLHLAGRFRGTGLLGARGRLDAELTSDRLDPGALGALADSLPLRGSYAGRIAIGGTVDQFRVDAMLRPRADSGQLRVVGAVNQQARRAGFDGTIALRAADLRALLGQPAVPRTRLEGSLVVQAAASRGADRRANWLLQSFTARGEVAQTGAEGLLATTLRLDASLDATALSIRQAELTVPSARVSAVGVVRRDSTAAPPNWRPLVVTADGDTVLGDSIRVAARIDSLARFASDLRRIAAALPEGDSLRAQLMSVPDSVVGEAFATAQIGGSLAALRATASIDARRLGVGPVRVGELSATGRLSWPLAGEARITLSELRAASAGFRTVTIAADSIDAHGARITARAESGDDVVIDAGSRLRLVGDTARLSLNSFRAAGKGAELSLLRPTQVNWTPAALTLDSTDLRATNGGRLTLSGMMPERGAMRGTLVATALPLADVGALLDPPRTLRGTIGMRVDLAGTRDAPTFDWYARGDSLGSDSVAIAGIEGDGSYADRELIGSLLVDVRRLTREAQSPTTALRGSFSVPVDLALRARDRRLLDLPVAARLDIDSLALAELPLALVGVRDVSGVADGHLLIKGTPNAPRVEGALTIANGGLTADAAGLELRNIALVVRGAGREVTLERLRMTSGAQAGDSLTLAGTVRLADGKQDRGQIALAGTLRDFAVLRRGDLADLDLSGTIEAAGTLDSVVVGANLAVPRGTIYRDAIESRAAIDLSSAEALELLGSDAPVVRPATGFDLHGVAGRIRRSSIRIRAGDELWVRAPTVAAKIGGEVTLVVDRGSLVPTGELTAQRGLYRLDLGVVRRTFDVDSGRVRFYGDAAVEPTVNVWASHDVRQASGGEITVRAKIAGTLERPTLELSTDDAIGGRVPDTEVISLLLFGAPTFALDGTSRSTVQSVTNVLLPSVGGYVEGALGRLLPVFNTVQLTTAGGTENTTSRFDLLNNVALSAGKQIGNRTFIRLNSGICRGGADAARDLSPWLGLAVEYRLSTVFSLQASADPGTAPCSRVGNDALSRLQFGFDLFYNWIF